MYRQPGLKYMALIDTYCTVDITQIEAKVSLTKSQLIVSLNGNSTVRLYYKVIRHNKYGVWLQMDYRVKIENYECT